MQKLSRSFYTRRTLSVAKDLLGKIFVRKLKNKILSGKIVEVEAYLHKLNEEILRQLQDGGEVFCSNTLIRQKFVLRACVVNFRTTIKDIEALPLIVVRIGRKIDKKLRPKEFGH